MKSRYRFLRLFPFAMALAVAALSAQTPLATAAVVPFTEAFSTGASGWVQGNNSAPVWSATGGVDNDGFVSMSQTITAGGFGNIIFRGNDANNASGDAFVGNWLDAGITQFSAYVRHDAAAPVNMYLRFDRGFGNAASTQSFSVAGGNVWTELVVPIIDSDTVFQSFGGAGSQPDPFGFVFSGIQNIQVVVSSPDLAGNTYTFGLDNVTAVPEPSSFAICLACAGAWAARRRHLKARSSHCPNE